VNNNFRKCCSCTIVTSYSLQNSKD